MLSFLALAAGFAKVPSAVEPSPAAVPFNIGEAPHPDDLKTCADVASHDACLSALATTCAYSCSGSGEDDNDTLELYMTRTMEAIHNATASFEGAEREAVEAVAIQEMWRSLVARENELPVRMTYSSVTPGSDGAYMDLPYTAVSPRGVDDGCFTSITLRTALTQCLTDPDCAGFSFTKKGLTNPDAVGSGCYYSSGGGCSDTCQYKKDNDCDDGGPGSEYSLCAPGTDCHDCAESGQHGYWCASCPPCTQRAPPADPTPPRRGRVAMTGSRSGGPPPDAASMRRCTAASSRPSRT